MRTLAIISLLLVSCGGGADGLTNAQSSMTGYLKISSQVAGLSLTIRSDSVDTTDEARRQILAWRNTNWPDSVVSERVRLPADWEWLIYSRSRTLSAAEYEIFSGLIAKNGDVRVKCVSKYGWMQECQYATR